MVATNATHPYPAASAPKDKPSSMLFPPVIFNGAALTMQIRHYGVNGAAVNNSGIRKLIAANLAPAYALA